MLKYIIGSRNSNFDFLDGVRGMALLIVIASHMSNYSNYWFAGSGKQGVWLFFILSSFLLSTYFLSNVERAKNPLEWMNYTVRRFMRIYPLYILVLLFECYIYKNGTVNQSNLLDHLTLKAGTFHFWTMPVELTFYLVLPFILLFVIVILQKNIWLSTIFVSGFTVIHQMLFPYGKSEINDIHLITYLPVFLIGCYLAMVYEKTKRIQFSVWFRKILDAIAISILGVMVATMPKIWSIMIHPVSNDYFHRDFIFYGILWALFIWCGLHGFIVQRIFRWKVIRLCGVVSYGGYLVHVMILDTVMRYMKMNVLSAILTIAITLLVSIFTHIVIEKPCMSVNLLKLKKQKIQPATAQ